MVILEIDTDLALERRKLVTALRSARIRREATSVSSRNSATPHASAGRAGHPPADFAPPRHHAEVLVAHPVEILLPRRNGLRKHHVTRCSIPADIDFVTLKPKFGRQANRLTSSVMNSFAFVIACSVAT